MADCDDVSARALPLPRRRADRRRAARRSEHHLDELPAASRSSTSRPSCAGRSPASATTRSPDTLRQRMLDCLAAPSSADRARRSARTRSGVAPRRRLDGPRLPCPTWSSPVERLALLARLGRSSIGAVLHARRRWSSAYLVKVESPRVPEATAEVAPVSDPVDWELAERVATRLARRDEPFADSYHYALAAARLRRAHRAGRGARRRGAPGCVARRPGPSAGHRPRRLGPGQHRVVPAPAAPAHRPARRAAAPSAARRRRADGRRRRGRRAARLDVGPGARPVRPARRRGRDADDQDLVYYVGPNVLALEKRFAFPPREFRLWLALHEVTHRAQFTGVPWLREHFLASSSRRSSSVDPDPKRFVDALTTRGGERARRSEPARRRRPRGAARDARAARGARPDRRADEPARGPRRRDDGPRRRGPHPERGPLRPGAARAAPAR